MDTGNPWDSKPLAASTTAPFDNPFDSPKADEGWANFTNNSSAAILATSSQTGSQPADSEMSPVKASDKKSNVEPQSAIETDAKSTSPDQKAASSLEENPE